MTEQRLCGRCPYRTQPPPTSMTEQSVTTIETRRYSSVYEKWGDWHPFTALRFDSTDDGAPVVIGFETRRHAGIPVVTDGIETRVLDGIHWQSRHHDNPLPAVEWATNIDPGAEAEDWRAHWAAQQPDLGIDDNRALDYWDQLPHHPRNQQEPTTP